MGIRTAQNQRDDWLRASHVCISYFPLLIGTLVIYVRCILQCDVRSAGYVVGVWSDLVVDRAPFSRWQINGFEHTSNSG